MAKTKKAKNAKDDPRKGDAAKARRPGKKGTKGAASEAPGDLAGRIADALRVGPGFALADLPADATPGFDGDKAAGEVELARTAEEVSAWQERLFAESKGGGNRSLLLVIQGMDTSGKGGIMRHVIGLMDPQGVQITAFKAPTAQERAHPFLWRIRNALPTPGMIGVFDRSHYEDVLIVRVRNLVPPSVWGRRYGQINAFEKSATQRGIRVVKVMLHLSPQEQKARLGERLARPDKYWKFNPGDLDERALWPAYQEAYQAVLDKTATADAPWYVVPADRKWYARLAVQHILLNELRAMNPQWPAADFDVEEQKARLAQS